MVKVGAKFAESEKKLVDAVLAFLFLGLGLVLLALGFVQALYELTPSIQYLGAELVVGAVVFALGMWVFKYRL